MGNRPNYLMKNRNLTLAVKSPLMYTTSTITRISRTVRFVNASKYCSFQEKDPGRMASARSVIEQGNHTELPHQPDAATHDSTSEFRFEMGQVHFQSVPY